MDEMDDDELLGALGVSVETKTSGGRTPRQERVIAGFEDIINFVKEHGRPPTHGEDRDIFERLYAVRLDKLRAEPEFRDLLAPFDNVGLLSGEFAARPAAPEPADDDYFFKSASQLSTTVTGAAVSSRTVSLIRKRPSRETSKGHPPALG